MPLFCWDKITVAILSKLNNRGSLYNNCWFIVFNFEGSTGSSFVTFPYWNQLTRSFSDKKKMLHAINQLDLASSNISQLQIYCQICIKMNYPWLRDVQPTCLFVKINLIQLGWIRLLNFFFTMSRVRTRFEFLSPKGG